MIMMTQIVVLPGYFVSRMSTGCGRNGAVRVPHAWPTRALSLYRWPRAVRRFHRLPQRRGWRQTSVHVLQNGDLILDSHINLQNVFTQTERLPEFSSVKYFCCSCLLCYYTYIISFTTNIAKALRTDKLSSTHQ